MSLSAHHDIVHAEKLHPIFATLESIASKKELRPRSAYQCFMKEKAAAGKAAKGAKSIKEYAAMWKGLSAKAKEPYVKMAKDEQAKATAAKKEFANAVTKNWALLEKHLEDSELDSQHKRDSKVAAAKKKKLEKRKARTSVRMPKMKRAVRSQPRTAPVAAPSSGRVSDPAKQRQLQKGLDAKTWEVRESTKRPGFFYYFNKRTGETQAERPRAMPGSAPAKRQRLA